MESPIFAIVMGFAFLIAISVLSVMHFQQMELFRTSLDANVVASTRVKAGLEIINFSCDEDGANVIVNNVGREKLILDTLDLYFPQRISRNNTSRTFEIINDFIDPGLWNPDELLNVTVHIELEDGNHSFAITNELGGRDSIVCII